MEYIQYSSQFRKSLKGGRVLKSFQLGLWQAPKAGVKLKTLFGQGSSAGYMPFRFLLRCVSFLACALGSITILEKAC